MKDWTPDLIVTDLRMPNMDGLQLCRHIRTESRIPIIVLSVKGEEKIKVEALDAGADDYIVKPFEFRELMARLRAIIRRRDGHAQSRIGTETLQLDLATREMIYRDVRQALSAREFAVLHALLERPGAILSREQLEEHVYGWNEPIGSNAIEVVIHGLRKRLGAGVILNVRGLGWRVPREEP
jgi:DNA-binding response OmpR family regulator